MRSNVGEEIWVLIMQAGEVGLCKRVVVVSKVRWDYVIMVEAISKGIT